MKQRINFVTGNTAKFSAARQALRGTGIDLSMAPQESAEIQADTVTAVAEDKARQAALHRHAPLIVENSGLRVPALGGFPGPYVKYTLQAGGLEGLLRLMDEVHDRAAHFESCLVHLDEHGILTAFTDRGTPCTIAGSIAEPSTHDGWSDLWPILIPEGFHSPLSALTAEEQDALTARWGKRSVFRRFASWWPHTPLRRSYASPVVLPPATAPSGAAEAEHLVLLDEAPPSWDACADPGCTGRETALVLPCSSGTDS